MKLKRALRLAGVVASLAVAGALGWELVESARHDALRVRPKREAARWISREAEPWRFWVIIPVYVAMAGTALYLAWALARPREME